MPGVTLIEAVALIVLRAVRIARPEHQHERLVARLEHRQHDLGGDVGEIVLLRDIGDRGAGRLEVAGLAVVAARRRGAASGRPAAVSASFIACDSGMPAVLPVGVVDDDGRARRCVRCGRTSASGRACRWRRCSKPWSRAASAGWCPRRRNCRRNARRCRPAPASLSMNGVTLPAARGDRIAGKDRVAERAGVAEIMAGGQAGRIRHGEGREQRMRIGEIDALVAHGRHGRRGLRRHLSARAGRPARTGSDCAAAWRGGGASCRAMAVQAGSEQGLRPERHGSSPGYLCCDVALDTPRRKTVL